VLHLLGLVRLGNKQYESAIKLFEQTLSIDPNHSTAQANRCVALLHQGRLAEALLSGNKAVFLAPHSSVCLRNRGNVLRALQLHEQAVADYERSLALQPGSVDVLVNRGNSLTDLGRLDEALESYDRALILAPTLVEVHVNRGNALKSLRKFDDALASYERASTLNPNLAMAHFKCGVALMKLNRLEEAVERFDRALGIDSGFADAHLNRGVALKDLQRLSEALASHDRALVLRPDDSDAYINRGNVLRELDRFEEALLSYDRALVLNPKSYEAHSNRGIVLQNLGQNDAALASYERAIECNEGFADAYYNRSHASLLSGDFVSGWADYEWRWRNGASGSPILKKMEYAQRLWLGAEPVKGLTVLLHSEQGLGDTIQFCRYAPMVAALGARVLLQVENPLANLLSQLDGVAQCLGPTPLPPHFDYHCPLMSLPLAFGTTLSTIPCKIPYLRPDDRRVRFWEHQLSERRKFRVGLVWAGGFRPDPDVYALNRRRNIPLAKLAVLKHPGIDFYSLQKGEPAESELPELIAAQWPGPEIIDFTHLLADFADTAALIENLNLVITVDTAVAHLAGALGKPVWILNRFDTCWRWLLNRTDSPWYPTMRIFRQPRPGNWQSVIDQVKDALDDTVARVAGMTRGAQPP
jgi:tetratricopeptide (TPR) repeat protein